MKNRYFNNQSIESVSESILNYIDSIIGKRRTAIIEKHNSALIVLDMQDYFLNPQSHAFVPSSEYIIPNVNGLVKLFTNNNMPVVFTRHINDESNIGMMSQWWKGRLERANTLSEISDKMNKPNHAKMIEKSQYDAFHNTELDGILKRKNVNTLVITGVMTNLCVETTARSAFVNGFVPVIPIDCTATYNIEFHKASALNLAFGCAIVCLSKDIFRDIK